jgi:hypothetical protein
MVHMAHSVSIHSPEVKDTLMKIVNELQSSTAQPADLPPFYAHYGGATQVENGKFITDNVLLGEILLNNVSMGLVESGYNWGLDYGGIFGLGWDFEERIHGNHSDKEVLYPSLMDVMYKEGYIESHLFALFMDDLSKIIHSYINWLLIEGQIHQMGP